jgi:long-chain fatty acid transport protein
MLKTLLIIVIVLPQLVFGQGYQVNLQGQVQQGMGSAGAAYVHDAAILFYNPGGAAFLNENQASIGMTPTFAKVTFLEHNTNESANTISPMGTPFTAYGHFQIKDSSRLKLGMAIYTPFGSTVEWEDAWVGRFALTRLELKSIFFQPSVSFRISDKIGIGAGFIYSYGKVNLQKDIPLEFQDGSFAHAELAGAGHGFGFNVGIYLKPTDFFSVGITYKSEISMKVDKGTATFTVPASVVDKFPSGNFVSALPLPQVEL